MFKKGVTLYNILIGLIMDEELLEYDRKYIWHPYTSMKEPLPVFLAERAEGVYIELSDGRKIIDGMSSWWCAVHGYNNERLNRAATNQLAKMAHVMFGGITHRPAIELAKQLARLTPEGLERVFYSDSGSVAVEVACKMALQYQHALGKTERTKLATICGGYHGDTWHAMSVCDPIGGMHSLYNGRLPIQFFMDRPKVGFFKEWDSCQEKPIELFFEQHHTQMAAFILEPIVQGAGGMYFYHPNYLRTISRLCSKYGVLLIADEIATGFGRSGKMFACEWADVKPDIMCVGKAITGGYMSFAATLATAAVADTISSGSPCEFMHGPTFMGNALATAIAVESVAMIEEIFATGRILEIEAILEQELSVARSNSRVKEVRVLGAIGVLEMHERVDMAKLQQLFVREGVWVRPFGRLVYVMPPYIITDSELKKLLHSVVKVVSL